MWHYREENPSSAQGQYIGHISRNLTNNILRKNVVSVIIGKTKRIHWLLSSGLWSDVIMIYYKTKKIRTKKKLDLYNLTLLVTVIRFIKSCINFVQQLAILLYFSITLVSQSQILMKIITYFNSKVRNRVSKHYQKHHGPLKLKKLYSKGRLRLSGCLSGDGSRFVNAPSLINKRVFLLREKKMNENLN